MRIDQNEHYRRRLREDIAQRTNRRHTARVPTPDGTSTVKKPRSADVDGGLPLLRVSLALEQFAFAERGPRTLGGYHHTNRSSQIELGQKKEGTLVPVSAFPAPR